MQAKVWALFVVIFSAFDAYLTLLHLQAGGAEWNPSMCLALSLGVPTFVSAKMTVTVVGVVLLAINRHVSVALFGLRLLVAVYASLMVYHLMVVLFR